MAHVVSKDTLTESALAGLARGLIGDSRVPRVHRELLPSLPFLDFGAIIGSGSTYSLESQVYLRADGTQAFLAPLSEERAPVSSLQHRLTRLSEVSILLQLAGPEGTVYVISVSGTKFYDQGDLDYIEFGMTNVATYQVLDIFINGNRLVYRAYDIDGNKRDTPAGSH